MRFIDLNGRIHNKEINSFLYGVRDCSKSKGQKDLGERLKELFPLMNIMEELPCFGTNLSLDFYIPSVKLAFEFDGAQHEEYNPFFHRTREGFSKSVKNDVMKDAWCEGNGIRLIRINDKNIGLLKDIIRQENGDK